MFIYQINLVRIYENAYEKTPSLLKKKKKKRVGSQREKALLRDNKTRIKLWERNKVLKVENNGKDVLF